MTRAGNRMGAPYPEDAPALYKKRAENHLRVPEFAPQARALFREADVIHASALIQEDDVILASAGVVAQ